MNGNIWRWRKLTATALLGLTLISVVSMPADSAPWRGRGRGWGRGWGGYRAYGMPYRGYGRAYPRYGYGNAYGYGGYGAVAPRYYSSNYFYGGATPYGYGYGGYSAPIAPGFGSYNYVSPIY
jgi:hypothetical protein